MSSVVLIGAVIQGLAYAFLAWGVYLAFRVLRFADIGVDGSLTLGAAVTAILITRGGNPVLAVTAAIFAGALAGTVTGLMHTRLGVTDLLAGILTMTALYSVNLHVMGRSNISLLDAPTLVVRLRSAAPGLTQDLSDDLLFLLLFGVLALLVALLLIWFLRTDAGLALRATGDNAQMITSQGMDTRRTKVLGLALSNGCAALAGALLAQYQGFADVSMGVGALVAGLAGVILGEALVGRRTLPWLILGVAGGSVAFRLLIAGALQVGFNPVDLKLITAALVLGTLALSRFAAHRRTSRVT